MVEKMRQRWSAAEPGGCTGPASRAGEPQHRWAASTARGGLQ